MRKNKPVVTQKRFTHEGAVAYNTNAEQELRRSVMACLLWEDQFYESGESITKRIQTLVPQVKPNRVAEIAIEAREQMNLRHVPLLLVREMARYRDHRVWVADTLTRVIQRADEMAEFLAIYWTEGKTPLASSVKRGLANAFLKFDEYQFAKWRGEGKQIKLRDVMFLVHPQPKTEEQVVLFAKIADNVLDTPDTWEVSLSENDGVSKRDKWTRLLKENRLGALGTLRNLRNFQEAGVEDKLITQALNQANVSRVLPFRFIAAARYAPRFEPVLEKKMFESLEGQRLSGRTVILVDVSGSMDTDLSSKSDMQRLDAACGVAMIGREICEDALVYTFSNNLVEVPARRGFALRDSIVNSQSHGSTYLGQAVKGIMSQVRGIDRLIVITDEQSHDPVPQIEKGYMINVASYQNGVGYGKGWTSINGWSESVFKYILAVEESTSD